MPVPTTIADLSTTAGSNYPLGTDTPTTGDDTFRALSSFIALLRDKLDGTAVATGVELASPELTGTTVASYISTPSVCAVSAYRSTTQTLTAGTNTVIFDTETADRDTDYDNTTGIFTAPVTGLYQIDCVLRLQNNSVTNIPLSSIYISRNNATADGADTVRLSSAIADGSTVTASSNAFVASAGAALLLTAADTIRIKETHTSASLSLLVGSRLSIHFVG